VLRTSVHVAKAYSQSNFYVTLFSMSLHVSMQTRQLKTTKLHFLDQWFCISYCFVFTLIICLESDLASDMRYALATV